MNNSGGRVPVNWGILYIYVHVSNARGGISRCQENTKQQKSSSSNMPFNTSHLVPSCLPNGVDQLVYKKILTCGVKEINRS